MAGSSGQKEDEPITEINMTPLVDVSLVLVIIFMAVAPFAIQSGIQVLHSKAKVSQQGKAAVSENVQVTLRENGALSVNGKAVTFEGLGAALQEALSRSKDRMVVVGADAKNQVGQVVGILDTARQAGAAKVAILKSEKA